VEKSKKPYVFSKHFRRTKNAVVAR